MMSSGIVYATRLRSGGSLASSARPGRVALARESARSVGRSAGRVRVRRSFSLLGCSVCVCTLASLRYKKIVDTIASSLCYAPTALPSCRRGGQRAEQSRLLTRFRPSREYFIGSGCVRLLFVWAVSARQRLALDCFDRFVPCTPQAPRMSSELLPAQRLSAPVSMSMR